MTDIHPPVPDRGDAAIIVPRLIERYHPRNVLDFGCNTGRWLVEFNRYGLPWTHLSGCDVRGMLPHFLGPPSRFFSSESCPFFFENSGIHMVLCLEVMEHIEEKYAEPTIFNLCRTGADFIVFSAATPGQGGWGHINEQPHSYWIEKFKARGYWPDEEVRSDLCIDDSPAVVRDSRGRLRSSSTIPSWYRNNLIVFSRFTT